MPALATRFSESAFTAVGIAQAGELIRARAEVGSLEHSELRPPRLEALYEMAYLRVFIGWENFLEETFVRLMCGYELPSYKPQLRPQRGPYRTLLDARSALYGGRDYLLWHNPSAVIRRCQQWFVGGLHQAVIGSSRSRLEWFGAVRHRIAHGSDQVRREMDIASVQLTGRRYPAASSGRLLRDWKSDDPMIQQRWLRVITDELIGLSQQIAP